jgi:hypothetical protein
MKRRPTETSGTNEHGGCAASHGLNTSADLSVAVATIDPIDVLVVAPGWSVKAKRPMAVAAWLVAVLELELAGVELDCHGINSWLVGGVSAPLYVLATLIVANNHERSRHIFEEMPDLSRQVEQG